MKDSDLIYGIMASLGKEEYSASYLKYLLKPFHVTDSSLRTTLSRMINKGVLQSAKKGKSAYYCFAEKGKKIGRNVSFSFKKNDWSNWDHTWWSFLFSIPAGDKALRHKVTAKLSAYRFASLYPGCWIRPLYENEKIKERIHDLSSAGFGHLTKMKFITELTEEKIRKLWKTESINNEFARGLDLIKKSSKKLETASPEEAFRLKMTTGNEIVQLLFTDPLLPDCYLREDWKGDELRESFKLWEKEVAKKSSSFSDREI